MSRARSLDSAIRRRETLPRRTFSAARFFYFPFDRSNRVRDRVASSRSGCLCLPTQDLRLDDVILAEHACGRQR